MLRNLLVQPPAGSKGTNSRVDLRSLLIQSTPRKMRAREHVACSCLLVEVTPQGETARCSLSHLLFFRCSTLGPRCLPSLDSTPGVPQWRAQATMPVPNLTTTPCADLPARQSATASHPRSLLTPSLRERQRRAQTDVSPRWTRTASVAANCLKACTPRKRDPRTKRQSTAYNRHSSPFPATTNTIRN